MGIRSTWVCSFVPLCAALAVLLPIEPRSFAQAPAPPVAVTLFQQPQWTLQPVNAVLQAGETQRFAAFIPGEYRSLVRWTASAGLVSGDGVYTAPAAPGTYTVTATGPGAGLAAQATVQVVPGQGTTTAAADRFVDSVGVNIHLHYDGTLYRDRFDVVKARLLELGVRHVRDGMIDTTWRGYYERHEELGRAGIRGVFIIDPTTRDAVMQSYPSLVPSAFEAYEGPNEYDASGRPNWAGILRDTMNRLHAVKSAPALARFPIFGPSLTKEASYPTLGDVSATMDRANVHDYLAGRHPGTPGWGNSGYGSIPWNLALVRRYGGGRPIVSTETGYNTGGGIDGVPEYVAGRYMPRLILEHFRLGVSRTYLYELCDQSGEQFGLLRANGTPKPSFVAVKSLLNLLADPGAEVAVTPLRYSVSGGGSDLRHLAFQRRDGTYFLALWLEQPAYDVNTRRTIEWPTQTVVLTLNGLERPVRAHAWSDAGTVATSAVAGQSQAAVAVSDRLLMLEIRR